MTDLMPFVTMMIVVRNEEVYIRNAVLSLLNQDYPKDRWELLVIDGMSTDRTVENARRTVEDYSTDKNKINVRYLKNPKKLLASGWNIGIREAEGEFVVRIDAHAQADSGLVSKSVEILKEKKDVSCAGGCIESASLTEKGRIISYVLSSPFGVGNARFRYAEVSGYVDTVAYGVYRKSIFEQAGYFNEDFVRNQDNDMHGRIKACGGRFYLDASIKSIYYSRATIAGMMKQAFGNGKWNMIVCKQSENKNGLSIRHFIPLFFVCANIGLCVLGIFCPAALAFLGGIYILYFSLAVFFACKKTKKFVYVLQMCVCYWLLHISYGAGSLKEILSRRVKGI